MNSDPYCPDAGDIIYLQFSPQLGREQAERRPALVLSPRQYNAFSRLCVVCPITNTVRGWKIEVVLEGTEAKTTGAVLADQVKSLSWTDRGSEFIEVAPPAVLAEARAKVKAVIGL